MVFLLALAAGSAHAQAHEISAWTAVLAAPDLTGRTRAWFDLHLRREEDRFWMIVRPGLGLQLTDAISAWGGYDFIPSIPDDGEASVEHRIWEQLMVGGMLGDRADLTSRTRLEQRFRPGGVGLRLREFLRLALVPENPDKVYPVLIDEIFFGLNATDWGAVAGFDQNWLFAGMALPVSHGGRAELGLMNILAPRDELEINWVIVANWFPPR